MQFEALPLEGAYCITPELHGDDRGWFGRFYCDRELAEVGLCEPIRQINRSRTEKAGTIRGMHFQLHPHAEIKIVTCLAGAIYDVIVDIRKDSPTYLQWYGRILDSKTMETLFVPKGFAHGFQSLADNCEIQYFVTEPYAPDHECGLRFDDPRLAINWPKPVTTVSDKDIAHALITDSYAGVSI